MDQIFIRNPEWLLLMLVIPFLFIPLKYGLLDFSWIQKTFLFVIRSSMIILIASALSDPVVKHRLPRSVASIFLVDVSRSITDGSLSAAQDFITESLQTMSVHDAFRVFLFDRELSQGDQMQQDPDSENKEQQMSFKIRRTGDDLATDIESSVLKSFAMFPASMEKRLVLLSDGNETSGNLLSVSGKARDFGVSINSYPLLNKDLKGEFMISGFAVSGSVFANKKFSIASTLLSTKKAEAECSLTLGNEIKKKESFSLEKNMDQAHEWNDLVVSEKGIVEVTMTCNVTKGEDHFTENNSIHAHLSVQDMPHVLYIDEESSQRQFLVSMLSTDFRVTEGGCSAIPGDINRLKEFDLVITGECPRTGSSGQVHFSSEQMIIFHNYVKDGGGLLFTGGPHSLGPGGYGGTYLEKNVLPVTLGILEEKDMPRIALVLILDRSGSMSGQKLQITKESAKATVSVLDRDDHLGVIAFDATPKIIVAMEKASNRFGIMKAISRITSGGGTNILPALKSAYKMLETTTADIKHVILLTDGISPREGVVETTEKMGESGITVSTVAVGHTADKKLLTSVADTGGGRYYYADNPASIPKIFVKETERLKKKGIVEERVNVMPLKKFAAAQIFKGVDVRNSPPLLGFVSVTPKKKADIVLSTTRDEPILVRWRIGLGKVNVFTSDVKSRWAYLWLRWEGFSRMMKQIVWDSLFTMKERVWDMNVSVEKGRLRIEVSGTGEDGNLVDGAVSKAEITLPDSNKKEISLRNEAPGYYEGEIEARLYGSYNISAVHELNGELIARSHAETIYPFPEELKKIEPDIEILKNISLLTGGIFSPGPQDIFKHSGKLIEEPEPIRKYLLIAALVMLLIDIFFRRIRIGKPRPLKWP